MPVELGLLTIRVASVDLMGHPRSGEAYLVVRVGGGGWGGSEGGALRRGNAERIGGRELGRGARRRAWVVIDGLPFHLGGRYMIWSRGLGHGMGAKMDGRALAGGNARCAAAAGGRACSLRAAQPAPAAPPSSRPSPSLPTPCSPFQIKHDGAEVRTTASTRPGTFWDDSRLSL